MRTRQAVEKTDARSILLTLSVIFIGIIAGLFASHISPLKIVAAVAALSLCVAAVLKVQWTLYVMIVLTYINFFNVVSDQGAPPIQKPFLAFILLAAFFHILYYGARPKGWLRPLVLIVTNAAIYALSLIYAKDLDRTQAALMTFATAAAVSVILLLLVQWGDVLRGSIWALLLAGLFMGSLVVYQYLTGTMNNTYWGFAIANLKFIAGGLSQGYRVTGPIGDANFFAQIMVVLIPLGIERFLREKNVRLRVLAAATAGVSLLAVIFSYSRGAVLALAVIGGLMMIRLKPKMWQIVLLGVLLLPLIFFIPESYKDRLESTIDAIPGMGGSTVTRPDVAIRGRVSEMKSGFMMFLDHPILGVGLGNFNAYYQRYSRNVGLDPRLQDRSAHSLYLQIAAETGVIGLATFAIILFALFRGLKRAKEDFLLAERADLASISAAFSVAMIGYMVAAIFLHTAYPQYLWLLLGLGFAIPNVARNELSNFRRMHQEATEFDLSDGVYLLR